MLQDNVYDIDKTFDYDIIKAIVFSSLEKIAKEEALEKKVTVTYDYEYINDSNNVVQITPPTPLLKLKIRNTTKYLSWRIAVLRRDNFTCQLCHASIKDNNRIRLEAHHPKPFDEICNENMVSTIEQALACGQLWDLNNGLTVCYRCHKDVEKLRTKLRNIFSLRQIGKSK
jgi:5-methylcytosine-specific restriction endonuclease McrA